MQTLQPQIKHINIWSMTIEHEGHFPMLRWRSGSPLGKFIIVIKGSNSIIFSKFQEGFYPERIEKI